MSKRVYKNIDEIVTAMRRGIDASSRMIAEATMNYLRRATLENLYRGMSEGKYYKRTKDVLNSISITSGSKSNRYNIGFDGRKIKEHITASGKFNAHADFYGDKITKDDLISWLEEGHSVPVGRSGNTKWRDGAFMLKETEEWLERLFDAIRQQRSGILEEAIRKTIKLYEARGDL